MNLKREQFGYSAKGEKIYLYTLTNDNGVAIKVTNYGCIITSVETPDKSGNNENIVLGFKSLEDYLSDEYINNCPCFGCVCGRYANRISEGRFSIDGEEFSLATNHGEHHLHGGVKGFDKIVWVPKKIEKPNLVGVEFKYRSLDMEEGYPGNADVKVTYTLNHKNEFQIEYSAETDKPTVINLTNHSYFNLSACRENIMGHTLQINAEEYTLADELLIPTGEFGKVAGTPFDFRTPHKVGDKIGELKEGYDLNYVLDNNKGKLIKAGELSEEKSGRTVEVFTSEPGMQLYSGYWIGNLKGKNGEEFCSYMGLALETQHYPDSPNHPDFPGTVLRPGEKFKSKTVYKFGVKQG
jgi:aldose 1-epimerase